MERREKWEGPDSSDETGEVGRSALECRDRECPGELGGSGLKWGEVRESGPGEVGGSTLSGGEEGSGVSRSVANFTRGYYVLWEYLYFRAVKP